MNDKNTNPVVVKHGMGFCSSLTLMFIAFKLLGILKFSWAWVLSPIWISIGLWILFYISIIAIPLLLLAVVGLWEFISGLLEDRKNAKIGKRTRKEYIDKGILIKRKDGTYGTKESKDD